VQFWEVGHYQQPVRIDPAHRGPIAQIAFSADSTRLVTAGWDRTARVWDVATGRRLASFEDHGGALAGGRLRPPRAPVVTTALDDKTRVWDGATGRLLGGPMESIARWVSEAAFSPDGRYIAVAAAGVILPRMRDNGGVRISDLRAGGDRLLTGEAEPMRCV